MDENQKVFISRAVRGLLFGLFLSFKAFQLLKQSVHYVVEGELGCILGCSFARVTEDERKGYISDMSILGYKY